MSIWELALIGVGLSMDAFAVAVCKGLKMDKINKGHCLVIALFFGGFQALMPFLGWCMGRQFQEHITAIDHWIAFILLAVLGGKMIWEALKKEPAEVCSKEPGDSKLDLKELLLLAIATSIDALAVGITFAFLNVSIVPAISIIGCITFLLSLVGVFVGNLFGTRYKSRAELAGGIILVLLGIKILLDHLGIL